MTRPWAGLGIGWILALIVLVLAILEGVASIAIPNWIMFALLSVALLI